MIQYKGLTAEELGITNAEITAHPEIRFYNVKEEPFRVYGLYDIHNQDHYIRIPQSVAAATSDNVKGLNNCTAGGRVRFVTSSSYVAIKCVTTSSAKMTNMCLIGSSGFDMYTKRNGRETFAGIFTPTYDYKEGYAAIRPILNNPQKGEREITINFPLYSGCVELYIGLDENATLSRHPDYKYEKPVVYYGSSITQGGCASRPGMAYESIIARRLDGNYVNLGFSGSAKAEDAMIEYLASLDYSVFVSDYDHNAPNAEHLQNTHEKLYKAIRAAHPDVPVVFVTKPDFWLTTPDCMQRRDIIYTTYNNARQRGEKVLFVDGYSLFEGEMREECTVDGCHPNDLGMARMADVIGKAVDFALSM
ncbi:MAG: SGNH/GDSL hydrolase family protein [Clostridia bacterium]|nr:SGNH/GDSL hydrolase family protein [Clostridia bacterium]